MVERGGVDSSHQSPTRYTYTTQELHFGGGGQMGVLGRKRALSAAEQEGDLGQEQEGGPEVKKTRAELMEEIIAKSKLFKVGACWLVVIVIVGCVLSMV